MRYTTLLCLVGAFAVLLGADAAVANHVDFIVDGEFTQDGDGSTIVAGDPGNILGGLRRVEVDLLSGTALSRKDPFENFLMFRNNLGTAGKLTLDYGNFIGGNGELNADLASMWNAFAVDFEFIAGSGLLSIAIESSAGSGMSAAQMVSGAGMYSFSFSDAGFAAVDFNDVDRISVMLQATDNSDFFIRSVTLQSIPGPGTLALLTVAGLSVHRRRRRL